MMQHYRESEVVTCSATKVKEVERLAKIANPDLVFQIQQAGGKAAKKY